MGLAKVANSLGAGRLKKDDRIDYGVGIEIEKKYGDRVEFGDTLAYVVGNGSIDTNEIESMFTIEKAKKEEEKLIYDVIK